jgi:hypothetical protein
MVALAGTGRARSTRKPRPPRLPSSPERFGRLDPKPATGRTQRGEEADSHDEQRDRGQEDRTAPVKQTAPAQLIGEGAHRDADSDAACDLDR